MRSLGRHFIEFSIAPDTVTTFALAANTAQAIDLPSGAKCVRLTGLSTSVGLPLNFYVNLQSTAAAVPSSGTTATTSTTGVSVPVAGIREFTLTNSCTGFSVIAQSSGYVHAEYWTV